eukprot:68602_1
MAQVGCHEMLNEQQIELLICGYMKQHFSPSIPIDVANFVITLFDDTFRWIITGDDLQKFLSAANEEDIYSKTYKCDGIGFILCVCPNGTGDSDKGYVRFIVYQHSDEEPPQWHFQHLDGNVQGPFSGTQLRTWFEKGYIRPYCLIRNESSSNSFTMLKHLFASGDKAFTHKIPKYWPGTTNIIEQPQRHDDAMEVDNDEDKEESDIDSVVLYHYLSSPQCAPHVGKGMTVLGESAGGGKMWAPYCMKLSECRQYESLQFNCYLQILDVEYKDKSKIYPLKQHITMKQNVHLEWSVESELLQKFKDCYDTDEYKSFYSPHFEDSNWSLMVYPNGDHKDKANTKGSFYLCLRTSRLPSTIGKVKVGIHVECNHMDKDAERILRSEVTRPDGWSTGVQIYMFKTSQLIDMSSLKFALDLRIIDAFDRNDCLISRSQCAKRGIVVT